MKQFRLRSACLIAVGLLGLLPGCSKPLDPVQSANAFFAKISQGKITEAYNSSTFAFQAALTFPTFEATARDLGLTASTLSCDWKQTDISANEAKLDGRVEAANGTKVPISVRLIQERGSWRLFALHTPKERSDSFAQDNKFTNVGKGVSFNSAATRELPDESVIRQLVEDNLVQFNDAIQRHSFANFYSNVSYFWQQQLTLHQLERTFQPFVDKQINLGAIRSLRAVFDAPSAINSEGLLVVMGHYSAQPHKVYFTLRYTYELPKWKLMGIDVQISEPDAPTLPAVN